MKNIKPDLLCASIALALTLVAGNAQAQAQGSAKPDEQKSITQLDAVEVTARGVTESLQRVPLPITAISE